MSEPSLAQEIVKAWAEKSVSLDEGDFEGIVKEVAALMADAERRGAERMRERAEKAAAGIAYGTSSTLVSYGASEVERAIRDLPVETVDE